jgi:transcription elongation factor SPT5
MSDYGNSGESEDYDISNDSMPEKRKKKTSSQGKKSKKRTFSKKYFIDDLAESAEEDSSEVDSDFENEKKEAEILKQKLPKRSDYLQILDPEDIAKKYDEKAAIAKSTLPKEMSHITHQQQLPSINDPKVWQVGCKKGKEKEAVINLLQKALHKQLEGENLEIFSAFASSHVKDYIYVEAFLKMNVISAIRGMHMLNENRVNLVPIDEMVDVFSMDKAKKISLKKGTFVRIRSGDYKGDLAQIVSVEEHRGRALIRVVPRLEKTGNKKIRGPSKLFNHDDYKDAEKKRDSSEQGVFYYCWNGLQFYSGFLHKYMSLRSLQVANVNPSLAEVQIFQTSQNDENEETIQFVQGRKIQFIQGDKVKVTKGDVKGLTGTVHTSSDGVICIIPHVEELCDQRYEFPVDELCKFFEIGDHIKVIAGRYQGITGMLVSTEDSSAEVICDVGKNVITVLCNDLKLTDEISSGTTVNQNYRLNDIVTVANENSFGIVVKVDSECLTAVMVSGEVRNIWFHEISKKFSPKKASAVDRDRNSLSEGDMVKISYSRHENYNKFGSIKNCLRGTLFLFIQGEGEYNILPVKASYCLLLGTETRNSEVPDTRRHDFMGKIVRIKSGPYRGYSGKVIEINETRARVEMSTLSKFITVELDACETIRSGEEGMSLQKQDVTRTPVPYSPAYGMMSTPAHDISSPWETPRHDPYQNWPKSPSAPRSYRN